MEKLYNQNIEYTSVVTTGLRKFFRKMGPSLESFILSPSFFGDMDEVLKKLKIDADRQTVW